MSKQLFNPVILNIALDGEGIVIDPSHTGTGGDDDRRAGSREVKLNIGKSFENEDDADLFE